VEITVRQGQSLFDIANQYYGSIEGMQWLIEDNDINLDQELQFGDKIKIRKGQYINKRVVDQLMNQTIATNG
jgi:hypothetical protein